MFIAVLSKPYSAILCSSFRASWINSTKIPTRWHSCRNFFGTHSGTYSESAEFSPRLHISSTKIRFNIIPSPMSSIASSFQPNNFNKAILITLKMLFFFHLKRQTRGFILFKLSLFRIEFCRIRVSEVKGRKNFHLVCSQSYKKSSVHRPPFLFCLLCVCPLDTCTTVSSSWCQSLHKVFH
jgi:hypothetical protein